MERWGCKLSFQFPIVKVLDYVEKWDDLKQDPNPFSMVVMAHIKARHIRKQDADIKKRWKFYLVKMLYEKGYGKKDILELFRFIDWLIKLPDDLEKQLWDEISFIEEEKKMTYVTNIERLGIEQGIQMGVIQEARENVLDNIETRFQVIPEDIAESVKKIEARDTLKFLLRNVITCESIDSFRNILKKHE